VPATPWGRPPPPGAARPLLHVAVACLHAEGGGAWVTNERERDRSQVSDVRVLLRHVRACVLVSTAM